MTGSSGTGGTAVNSGIISGEVNNGILLSGGGSVNNFRTGDIEGGNNGVVVTDGSGTVINGGLIIGYANDGVLLSSGGSVSNAPNGVIMSGITGNGDGVVILNGAGSVINAGIISDQSGNAVYLGSGGGVTNLAGGTIGGNNNGVEIVGGSGTVINSGTISGTNGAGVYMGSGGSVNNTATGTITAITASTPNQSGVWIEGGPGSVANAGTISGVNGDGIYMGQGGIVTNFAGGTIAGNANGIHLDNVQSTVVNAGTIIGTNFNGVYLNSGSVVNASGGTITGLGQDGVYVDTGSGAVINAGTITGVDSGVYFQDGGSVSNATSGTITGGYDGVTVYGAGSVDNSCAITGNSHAGIDLQNGGSVNNAASGTIAGGEYGVEISGGGTVTNSGSVSGASRDGVRLWSGGTVDNAGGTIAGYNDGVKITGDTGTVINSGTVIGTNNDGVYLGSGGSVNNAASGTITGGNDGVEVTSGGTGTVVNAGTIAGTGNVGVYVYDGSVVNQANGAITGDQQGVYVGDTGFVSNAGSITGTNSEGIYIENDGYVDNKQTGNITGGTYGIYINYPGWVTNAGSITGLGNDGIWVGDSLTGYVTNAATGTIAGNNNGIYVDGVGTVINFGTIVGTNNDGVYMSDGGSVNNAENALISGGVYGVQISGSSGSVVNAGTIVDTGIELTAGVYLGAGGSVSNLTTGYISGGVYGVQIDGGEGTVVNAGTIIGNSGTAIQLGDYNNTVTFQTGSLVIGDTVGGNGEGTTDAAILQGHGQYDYNYYNFESLNVQGDPAAWNDPAHSWNLTGYSTFSVGATVESGLLRINGGLTTPLLTVNGVASPALNTPLLTNYADILESDTTGLGGTGVITGIVDNHGYISPGNSIGTLTIIGSYTNGGNYYAEVTNTGASDHISISDTATINSGNVIVNAGQPVFDPSHGIAGIYAVNTTYNILTATNGRSGMFTTSSVIQPTWPQSVLFPLAGSSLVYDPTNVYLVLHRTPFTSVARSFNQNSVAGALDNVGVVGLSPTMANLVYDFYWLNSGSSARMALDSLSGEIHGSMGLLDVQQQGAFNNTIAQRTGRISVGGGSGEFATSWKPVLLASAGSTPAQMPEQKVNQPMDFWMQGIGSFGQLKNDGNATGGNYTISGMSGGMDYRVSPKLLVGFAGGYSHDNAGVGGPGANGAVDAYQIGGYGGYQRPVAPGQHFELRLSPYGHKAVHQCWPHSSGGRWQV